MLWQWVGEDDDDGDGDNDDDDDRDVSDDDHDDAGDDGGTDVDGDFQISMTWICRWQCQFFFQNQEVRRVNETVAQGSPLRKFVEIILKKAVVFQIDK